MNINCTSLAGDARTVHERRGLCHVELGQSVGSMYPTIPVQGLLLHRRILGPEPCFNAEVGQLAEAAVERKLLLCCCLESPVHYESQESEGIPKFSSSDRVQQGVQGKFVA